MKIPGQVTSLESDTDNFSPTLSDETEPKDPYDFYPIRKDKSDELTQSLFAQLEKGKEWDPDIRGTIDAGANLYAKKTAGNFNGNYPIHVAAHNVGDNSEAIEKILQIFTDPNIRRDYIYLKNKDGKNVLDILIEIGHDEENTATRNIVTILSYLHPDEQYKLCVENLQEELKSWLDAELKEPYLSCDCSPQNMILFAQVYRLLKNGSYVEMCQQMKQEQAKLLSGYDSGDEALGDLGEVTNSTFTARVSYRSQLVKGKIKSIPELTLIPSDWRLKTATEDNTQGDHVIAYVLLLSSLTHCKGNRIKTLPDTIHKMICSVLPDFKEIFEAKLKSIHDEVKKHRTMRKETIASLQIECNKPPAFLVSAEESLKRTEIEYIARHIEYVVDEFIKTVNKLKGESFSHERKKTVKKFFLLEKMSLLVDKNLTLAGDAWAVFRKILKEAILDKKNEVGDDCTNITDTDLKSIHKKFTQISSDIAIPQQLQGKGGKMTQETFVSFLQTITPLKKYHEGRAIKTIREYLEPPKRVPAENRQIILKQIGQSCAKLFDYPKVYDDRLDNENVLYEAIPRHMIILYSAFVELRNLSTHEQEMVYDALLDHILTLQLWSGHTVLGDGGQKIPLTLELLKTNILKFANLDNDYFFTMKPSSEHPKNQNQALRVASSSSSQPSFLSAPSAAQSPTMAGKQELVPSNRLTLIETRPTFGFAKGKGNG